MLLPAKALILYQIIFIYIYLCRIIIPQTGSFLLFSEFWRRQQQGIPDWIRKNFIFCLQGKEI